MAFTEDLTVFFADFGVEAVPPLGTPITVIFDRATVEAMGGEITTDGPIALAITDDVADYVSHESQLEIGDTLFTIVDKKPDGTGLTLLVLTEAC